MIDGYTLRQAMAQAARQIGQAWKQIRFVMGDAVYYKQMIDRLEQIEGLLKYTKKTVARNKLLQERKRLQIRTKQVEDRLVPRKPEESEAEYQERIKELREGVKKHRNRST